MIAEIEHRYWQDLVFTRAGLDALKHGADEQEMTVAERQTLGLAAERKRAARRGRCITVADAEHAVWEVITNRWR